MEEKSHAESDEILLEWESDGDASLRMYAWSQARHWNDQNGFPQKVFFGVAILILFSAGLLVAILSFREDKFWMLLLGLAACYFAWVAFSMIFLMSRAKVERRYLNHYRKLENRGEIESTAGHWQCRIDEESVEYTASDRGLVVKFPLETISSVARVHGQVALFVDGHFRGHLPDTTFRNTELFELLRSRVLAVNPAAEFIEANSD